MVSALSKNWDDSSAVNNPPVGIVILNWNSAEETLRCLESVFQQIYPNYFVIVIDNGSIENPLDAIQVRFPDVITIRLENNLGYTGGCNLGMRKVIELGAEYVWLLNNDATVATDCMEKLVREAQSNPSLGLLSPVIHSMTEPETIIYCGTSIDVKNHKSIITNNPIVFLQWEENRECIVLWGTALFIPRLTLEKIGYFDNRFFAYYEDTDYSLRVLQNGLLNKVVIGAKCFHRSEHEERKPHYYYYMTRNRYWFWMSQAKTWKEKYQAFWLEIGAAGRIARRLKRQGFAQESQAVLSGIWNALIRKYGDYDSAKVMPSILQKWLTSHPHFWANIMLGNFSVIRSRLKGN